MAGLESPDDSSEGGRLAARVSVIPHTRLATSLAYKNAGDEVNIELDVLASYVRAAVAAFFRTGVPADAPARGAAQLDMEQLRSWGYR